MPMPKPLTDAHGEGRAILQSDIKRFKAAAHMLPPSLQRKVGIQAVGVDVAGRRLRGDRTIPER